MKVKVEGKKEDVSKFMDFLYQHFQVNDLMIFDTYAPTTAFFNLESKGRFNEKK